LQRWAGKAGAKVGILAKAIKQEFDGFFLRFGLL